ncbi:MULTISPECIES: alpha/beta fold hydrolase [Nonomuraea]|uniref:Alpha/beta fold hydrolase n=2 Tax=Nonomuraea TaxID=83681 RepID=A0ABW1BMH0_9ACTN|nr:MULTISPECIES: alpha/beta hydrolase [Nonomuraea]MDA0645883.1 alpha/beta hydrolase [Nonomuraea ferruginea]TXK39308.1 alpha/beta hydrolase [Nonomuraea sp. C10]
MEAGTLAVPGAELYYELRGSGPVLLLVNGGEGDAGAFAPLAALLADHYTVITYDPRGNSRSRLTSPIGEQRIPQHARDAHLLLRALCREPAYLFGTSYGGMVVMDLLAARPEQVRAAVAHEPLLIELLPDADRWHAAFQEVYETYEREGAPAAVRALSALLGVAAPPEASAGLPPPVADMLARVQANMSFCVAYELRSFVRYVPDLEALRGGKFTLATGGETGSTVGHRTALALAEELGLDIAGFPGGHVGFLTHPAEFAKTLYEVLES